MTKGAALEQLVRTIEGLLLPAGFTVQTNKLVLDSDGVPIAELDIEVRGKLGSGTVSWLIECRDRPSHGSAPRSWMEQLVGRRESFRFNKITAVSTTGFSKGASDLATEQGIELRTVDNASASDVADWFAMDTITLSTNHFDIAAVTVEPIHRPEGNFLSALRATLSNVSTLKPILRLSTNDQKVSVNALFAASLPNAFDGMTADDPPRTINAAINVPPDAHLLIDTDAGAVEIKRVLVTVTLSVRNRDVPVSTIRTYKAHDTDKAIAQTVSFSLGEDGHLLEFHKLSETGETHVLLRRPGLAR